MKNTEKSGKGTWRYTQHGGAAVECGQDNLCWKMCKKRGRKIPEEEKMKRREFKEKR